MSLNIKPTYVLFISIAPRLSVISYNIFNNLVYKTASLALKTWQVGEPWELRFPDYECRSLSIYQNLPFPKLPLQMLALLDSMKEQPRAKAKMQTEINTPHHHPQLLGQSRLHEPHPYIPAHV